MILREIRKQNSTEVGENIIIEGYTRATTVTNDGNRVIFYANPYFLGRKWYDWAYVHFEEINASGEAMEKFYPANILGFIIMNGTPEAVTQCSEKPLMWSDLKKHFLLKTSIGTDLDVLYISVPITALVHPLCVIPDEGGDKNTYIIILPKCNWSRYFGDKVLSEYNKYCKNNWDFMY